MTQRRRVKRFMTRRKRLMATVLTAVLALTGIGAWIVYGTGAFALETIVVKGAGFTDEDRVRDSAALAAGTALAAVDTEAAARRVAEIPSVRQASVERDWPHGIVITVDERTARLAVPKGEKFTLVDAEGVAFRTVSKQPPNTVQTTVSTPEPGDAATRAVLAVLPHLTPQLENRLVSVKAPTASRVELKLKDSRTVFWGDASESGRKAEVATALLGRGDEHLDVSAPDVPTVS